MIKLNGYNYLVISHAVKNGGAFKISAPETTNSILVNGVDEDGHLMFSIDGDRKTLNPNRCEKLTVVIPLEDFSNLAKRFDQENVQALVANLTALKNKNEFTEGDLVQWKAGLKSHEYPTEGQSAIVTEVLDEPLHDDSECVPSMYYSPKYDLKIGVMDNGKFIEVHVDSRRFEHVKD